ncbi:hypothetical protein BMS3Abin17_00938 [archaeon BMS3Abin17]|nr:hypothetical protein BMS3Abin17_00938 [archaeon BMS3Abin17]HDZ60503.1 hypothetical protein [Candidatus Pacearchaeota archaeon]
MNLQFYIEKLKHSKEYKDFMKENPKAHLCGGFFIIDKENPQNPDNKAHLDVYIPSKKKMFNIEISCKPLSSEIFSSETPKKIQGVSDFQLDGETKLHPVEMFKGTLTPKKIKANSKLDFSEIEDMIYDKMEKEGIKNKLQRIIMILQNKDNKDFWICTVFISGLGLLKVNIDDASKKIILFEKKSLFDMLKFTGKKKSK